MKKILLFIFGSILMFPAFSQQVANDSSEIINAPRKFNWHVSVGSQFSSYSSYGSGISTFITPTFSYDINKRLKLQGGFNLVTTNYFGIQPYYRDEVDQASSGNISSALLFVSGSYFLNKNLRISGSAFKEFPLSGNQLSYSPFQPYAKDGAQGVRMDIYYKIGKHMEISVGYDYTKGINWYNSPFGNSIYGTHDSYGMMPRW
jgi:hypothetical protein